MVFGISEVIEITMGMVQMNYDSLEDFLQDDGGKVDLHYHIDEGAGDPLEEFRKCLEKGYDVIAFTEHNSVDGLMEINNKFDDIIKLRKKYNKNTKIIPSIELTSNIPSKQPVSDKGTNRIHILGLGINFKNESFQNELIIYQEIDNERTRRIFNNIAKRVKNDTGKQISFADFVGERDYLHYTTGDLVEYLYKQVYKETRNGNQIKRKFFHFKSKTYVGHEQALDVFNTIYFVKKYGGIPIVAHPDNLSKFDLMTLKDFGLKGIEIINKRFKKDPDKKRELYQWARELGLFIVGGSDEDPDFKPLPYRIIEQFEQNNIKFNYL